MTPLAIFPPTELNETRAITSPLFCPLAGSAQLIMGRLWVGAAGDHDPF